MAELEGECKRSLAGALALLLGDLLLDQELRGRNCRHGSRHRHDPVPRSRGEDSFF